MTLHVQQADPTPEPQPAQDVPWTYQWGDLPDGRADVCGPDGHTLVTLTPCGPENPTIAQACQDPAYREVLGSCATIPVRLPTTGLSTAATGTLLGTGASLVLIGATLAARFGRRA